jgi:hypothetical protein
MYPANIKLSFNLTNQGKSITITDMRKHKDKVSFFVTSAFAYQFLQQLPRVLSTYAI